MKSPPERPQLKYSEEELEALVDAGTLSEAKALKILERRRGPKPSLIRNINKAFAQYTARVIPEDLFYQSLSKFIEKTVKRHSTDRATFSNLEDAISDSLLEVWQRLQDYDPKRSRFSTFVTMVVLSRIKMTLRKYKSDRGQATHIQLDETLPASSLNAEKRLLFNEWLKGLDAADGAIMRMMRDGLTQAEIAEALDISQPAISQRLARLRASEKPPF